MRSRLNVQKFQGLSDVQYVYFVMHKYMYIMVKIWGRKNT